MSEPLLVSCVMLTHDRPQFVQQAIRYWDRQTYLQRELIIVDTGKVPMVTATTTAPPGAVQVLRAPGAKIGHARNLGCGVARGALIATWDDDDWYAADRLAQQVEFWRTRRPGHDDPSVRFDVIGSSLCRVYELAARRSGRLGLRNGLFGPSMMFTAATWKKVGFREVQFAEELYFCRGRVTGDMGRPDWVVYIRHGSNVTVGHDMARVFRQSDSFVPKDEARKCMGDDVAFYDRMG